VGGVSAQRTRGLLDSANYAFEGIIHVLRTQRNMRIHIAVAIVVIIVAAAADVSKLELAALFISIAFVLIAEMFNSAIEGAIDVATSSFDPLAKLAKDMAAGAVLIAAINAVAVGYLVFSGKNATRASRLIDRVREVPAELTIIALVVTVVAVIWLKVWTGSGTPLRGGLPSGHAALAFAGWIAVTYAAGPSHRFLVSTITFILAMLVAQTRLESGIHSSVEILLGGLLGALTTLVLFQLSG
jgi:diacylglycerol kinase (ATP)